MKTLMLLALAPVLAMIVAVVFTVAKGSAAKTATHACRESGGMLILAKNQVTCVKKSAITPEIE